MKGFPDHRKNTVRDSGTSSHHCADCHSMALSHGISDYFLLRVLPCLYREEKVNGENSHLPRYPFSTVSYLTVTTDSQIEKNFKNRSGRSAVSSTKSTSPFIPYLKIIPAFQL